MGKWTPGPWRVIVDDTGGQFSGWPSVEAPEDIDASIIHRAGFKQEFWGDWSKREALANARLIAAAPELVEALREVLAYEPLPHIWREVGLAAEPIAEKYTRARALLVRINGDDK